MQSSHELHVLRHLSVVSDTFIGSLPLSKTQTIVVDGPNLLELAGVIVLKPVAVGVYTEAKRILAVVRRGEVASYVPCTLCRRFIADVLVELLLGSCLLCFQAQHLNVVNVLAGPH